MPTNVVKILRSYIEELHSLFESENYDVLIEKAESPKEVSRLSRMIGDVDEYLTGNRRPSDSRYNRDASELLEGGRPVIHLSDGGYSRLTLSMDRKPHMWIDKGISTKRVVEKWEISKSAGDVILYDQENPSNNEIKQPGPDVGYRAEGPTTYAISPDEKEGVPAGGGVGFGLYEDAPPASSRVIPQQMKQNLEDNYSKFSARRRKPKRFNKNLVLNIIYDQSRDPEGIEWGSAHVISPHGETDWLVSYRTYTGKTRKVIVGGHETGPGRVYLSIRPYNSRQAALISEIMANCGPEIVKRSKGISFRRTRIIPAKHILTYEVTGSTGDKYKVYLKGVKKGNVKAIAKMPIKVACTCNFFRWSGPEHWAKSNGFLYGRPVGTASKPVVRDPKGKHWVCKHVYAILDAKKNLRFANWNPGSTPGTPVPMSREEVLELVTPDTMPDIVTRVATRYLLKD